MFKELGAVYHQAIRSCASAEVETGSKDNSRGSLNKQKARMSSVKLRTGKGVLLEGTMSLTPIKMAPPLKESS